MRIHFTDNTRPDPRDIARLALSQGHEAGTIAPHVGFKTLTVHRGGEGFAYALEVQLEGTARDRGRRLGNSGSYGAGENYTATYDEWGFFLAALYRMDEGARCAPNFKRDIAMYYDAADFHEQTGRTYDPAYIDYVGQYGDDYCYRSGRNVIGRRGAGRVHYDSSATRWAKDDPRDAAWLRDLHAGKVF